MTEQQIIAEWFQVKENTDRLPTFHYSQEVYHMNVASCHVIINANGVFYRVHGVWQKMEVGEKVV